MFVKKFISCIVLVFLSGFCFAGPEDFEEIQEKIENLKFKDEQVSQTKALVKKLLAQDLSDRVHGVVTKRGKISAEFYLTGAGHALISLIQSEYPDVAATALNTSSRFLNKNYGANEGRNNFAWHQVLGVVKRIVTTGDSDIYTLRHAWGFLYYAHKWVDFGANILGNFELDDRFVQSLVALMTNSKSPETQKQASAICQYILGNYGTGDTMPISITKEQVKMLSEALYSLPPEKRAICNLLLNW